MNTEKLSKKSWPKFALSAFMHKDNTIINAIMLPSVLSADGVTIRLTTDYPFKNKMNYYIET